MFRILVLVANILALSACAPKESADVWQLAPPSIEMKNTQGIATSMKAGEIGKSISSTVFADANSGIRFEMQDHGFAAESRSRCVSDGVSKGEFTQTFITSGRQSLISVLPVEVFEPSSLKRIWTCEFQFHVTNSHGSKAGGTISGVKVNLGGLVSHLQTPIDGGAKRGLVRRLICENWWNEGSEALETIASLVKVHGTDTRRRDRQPLCSVLEIGTDVRFLGFYRPTFESGVVSVSNVEILIPATNLSDLFRRKLFSWVIRNEEGVPITVFIPATTESVRLSAITKWRPPDNGITLPVRVFPLFSQSGGSASRQTNTGFYVTIQPRASAVIELKSNRASVIEALVNFQNSTETSHLIFETSTPMPVLTLGTDINPERLLTMENADLDSQLRDARRPEMPSLLDPVLILEPGENSGFLKRSKMTIAELAMHKKIATPAAVEVPLKFDGSMIY